MSERENSRRKTNPLLSDVGGNEWIARCVLRKEKLVTKITPLHSISLCEVNGLEEIA